MEINRLELLKALDSVQPGLATKEIIEQTQSFLFTDGNVITFNDQIAVRCPIDIGIEGAVKATEFHRLLSKTKEETFEFEIVKNELRMKGKKTRAGLKLETELNSDLLAEIDVPSKWNKVPETLIQGLKFCLFSTSSDMSRQVLTCVLVEGNTVVSCDGFRLTEFDMGKVAKTTFKKPVLIPSPIVRELISYSPTHYSVSAGWIHFKMEDDVVFSCRSLAGKYPDTGAIKDQTGDEIQFTLPETTREMIERAQIFASDEFNQDELITIKVGEGKIMIQGDGSSGWVKDRTKVDYDGEVVTFAISPAFLLDVFDLLQTVEIGDGRMFLKGENFLHVVRMFAR